MSRAVAAFALVVLVLFVGDLRSLPPVTCGDPCDVASASSNYSPPVATISDGASVRWVNADGVAHIHVETPVSAPGSCYRVVSTPGGPSPEVRFDITEDGLVATTAPGTPDEERALCANAVGSPTTGYTLAYHCTLHPLMRGTLVVLPV